MKNLSPFRGVTISLYKLAVGRKNEGVEKGRLIAIEGQIANCFDKYNDHFTPASLIQIQPEGIRSPEKDDLLSLYKYDSFAIREFNKSIKNQQPRGVRSICQNCSIDSIGTLDHVIPKEEFPEFSVNPLNLFPCCSKCNSYKSSNWRFGDKMLFLNLYLDELPEEQYLFVQINGDNLDNIDFEYFIENRNGIEENLFEQIKSHFTRLHLLERMNLKAVDEFDKLIIDLETYIDELPMEEIFQIVTAEAHKLKQIYGQNHWLPVLKLALIGSEVLLRAILVGEEV